MLTLALLTLVALGGHPESEDLAVARKHFATAERLFRQTQYAEAIVEFEAAYRHKPRPELFFNIARCHEALGNLAKALYNYRRYLGELPSAPDREIVAASVEALQRQLRARGRQLLVVRATPSGAHIIIDEIEHGQAPVAAELAPGKHRVSASLDGYASSEQEVSLTADRPAEIDLALTALSPSTITAIPRRDVDFPVRAPGGAKSLRTWAYIAIGTSGAALATGVGLGLASNSARSEMLREEHPKSTVQSLHDTAAGRATGANIAYGTAAVTAAVAIVLYLLEPTTPTPSPQTGAASR